MIRHVDAELQELKQLILQMGGSVEKALAEVCQALFRRDASHLEEVHRQEKLINELQISVDQHCMELLAKQAPVARDLRLVIAVIKSNTDLERMGDQAVNIAHCAADLLRKGQASYLPQEIMKMAEKVRGMVRDSLDAFVRRDVQLSHDLLGRDDEIDGLKDIVIQEMIAKMRSDEKMIEASVEFIMIAKNFERLADHATNIAEEVIFLATGDDVRHGHMGPAGTAGR